MKAVYFAWVRERVGKNEEELDPPAERGHGRRADRLAVGAAARATPTLSSGLA